MSKADPGSGRPRTKMSLLCLAIFWVSGLWISRSSSALEPTSVTVGSKKFPESALLAEIFAQAAEARGVSVERKLNLGNTAILFEGLKSEIIDVYPEYAGTALELLGGTKPPHQSMRVHLEGELSRRHGLYWGPPLGFANSYALGVRGKLARTHRLKTIGDLARLTQSESLRWALSHEFIARTDGWTPLARLYDLRGQPSGVEHGVAYQLLRQDQADVIDVYTSEGLVLDHDIVVLGDDKQYFPDYAASFIYGPRLARSPELLSIIAQLAGRLDMTTIRRLNRAVEVEGEDVRFVATGFLRAEGLVALTTGPGDTLTPSAPPEPETTTQAVASFNRKTASFYRLVIHDRTRLLAQLWRHIELTLGALVLIVALGIPAGFMANRNRVFSVGALGLTGALQTLPSLALLVFMLPLMALVFQTLGLNNGGLVTTATIAALLLYGLLPVVRNTKHGLEQVDGAALDAARGLGMTRRQILVHVELPLAAPVVLAGVRTAAVLSTGSATLGAFVGAGGLGEPIVSGLSVQNYTEVMTGAIPAALLALVIDAAFGLIQRGMFQRAQVR